MDATFSISPSANTGLANASTFTFVDTTSVINPIFLSWDFGDGTFGSTITATHVYEIAGFYDVSLTIVDNFGTTYTGTSSITATDYLNAGITWVNVPLSIEQGQTQRSPLRIELSAVDMGEHVVQLYSQFSNSAPFQPNNAPNRWSVLQPYWRFLDTAFNFISSITTTDTVIYFQGSAVGITGYAEFYYVDDAPVSSPIVLWATLQTSAVNFNVDKEPGDFPSYANSKVAAPLALYIDSVAPHFLGIGEDAWRDIYPIKWQGGKIPHLITVRGKALSKLDMGIHDYPIIFTLTGGSSVTRGISGCDPTTSVFEDSQTSIAPGYLKSNVKTTCFSTSAVAITAAADVNYEGGPRLTPYVWIGNPKNLSITQIYDPPAWPTTISQIVSTQLVSAINTMSVSAVSGEPYAGLYGYAVDPNFNVWVSDTDLDLIYKIDSNRNIIQTIHLSAGSSPTSICLDSNLNLYVALHDADMVAKFNPQGQLINTITTPPSTQVPSLSGAYSITQDWQDSGYPEPAIASTNSPTIVDTDRFDNLWVCYETETFNALIQYDSNGNYLQHIHFDLPDSPLDFIVDSWDNEALWVSVPESWGPGGSIRKYSSSGVLLSSVKAFTEPGNLVQDQNGNIWCTFGLKSVGLINTQTGGTSGFEYDPSTQVFGPLGLVDFPGVPKPPEPLPGPSAMNPPGPFWFDPNVNVDEAVFQGIACDAKNRIWIIDSENNVAYVVTQSPTYTFRTFPITPDLNVEIYNDTTGMTEYSAVCAINESAQAFGDWTGFKWSQKYAGYRPGNKIPRHLTGTSAPFNLYAFVNPYDIRKFNESFNIIDYIKSLPMPERLADNTVFFDQFLGSAIGGVQTADQSVGRLAYERIANFVENHQDVDTCGINQLYSMAQAMDVPLDNYDLAFPPELRRLMDIVSISHAKLWGARSRNANRFQDDFTCCSDCKPINKGPELDFATAYVSAGTLIVVKDKFSPTYTAVPILCAGDLAVYPLSSLVNDELNTPLDQWYQFFAYIPIFDNIQVEGVINWDDEFTTLQETNSGLDAWYGVLSAYGDMGIIETMLNYALHRGLGLVDDPN